MFPLMTNELPSTILKRHLAGTGRHPEYRVGKHRRDISKRQRLEMALEWASGESSVAVAARWGVSRMFVQRAGHAAAKGAFDHLESAAPPPPVDEPGTLGELVSRPPLPVGVTGVFSKANR